MSASQARVDDDGEGLGTHERDRRLHGRHVDAVVGMAGDKNVDGRHVAVLLLLS
jgi:hypothetical protein